jgi:hypothetical protein
MFLFKRLHELHDDRAAEDENGAVVVVNTNINDSAEKVEHSPELSWDCALVPVHLS